MNLDYQLDGPDGAPVIVLSNSLGTTRAMWQPQIEALTPISGCCATTRTATVKRRKMAK
ncbi:3-oxoadipate enol-lactonase [Klebsiella pneumoniae]|uniref:3-oxoadipate enol-lactonase n=1 Tax=Klebsiella pneumoniae TaxID=573 RepID=A0A2X3F4S4_KLEPN|nr:3-oxoadipate enol-lactonase [Klebsiella pneumoniae]